MKTTSFRHFIATVAAAIVMCAYPNGLWAMVACTNSPPGGRLLLLVPQDFERLEYISYINGIRTHHDFGEQATDELRAQLGPFFSSVTVESVDSVAAAKERLDSGDYDRPDSPYDLVAVPEFRDVDSWIRWDHYGFRIVMGVKFYTPDESKVTRIKGRGESNTGFYGFSPGRAGVWLSERLLKRLRTAYARKERHTLNHLKINCLRAMRQENGRKDAAKITACWMALPGIRR